MNNNSARPISRQALGRTAFLGSLYDATTDEFCERTLVNDDIPAVAIRYLDENHGHSEYEFDTVVSKKLRKLNVDLSLSLSILGGLVKSAGASSSYLYTRDKTSQQIEATFIHRSITRTETLNVSHKELKTRVEPTALRHKNATHVVTSIRWGADVFAQFEAKSTTEESKHVAKAGLKLELSKLLSKFISVNPNNSIAVPVDTIKPAPAPATTDGTTPATNTATPVQIDSGSTSPQISFENTSTATAFNYKITLFGDLIPTTCPKNIEELIAMLPSITVGLQKTNGGKGRPLEYIMLPIAEVAEILGQELLSDRIFRAVEEHLTQEIQSIFDECDQLRTTIHTMYISIKKVEDFFLEEEINQLTVHEQTSARIARDVRTRIGKMLVRVRSGNAEQSEFDQLLVELESQVATLKTQTKQFERGDISTKLKYALELKEKYVITVREPDSLAIIQHRHPKHQLIVLYASNELRTSSKDKWIAVYFEFIHRINENSTPASRFLFCYFDYDLHPNFQPQHKKLEVREYIGTPIIIPTARVKPKQIDRSFSGTGVESLLQSVTTAAAQSAVQWHREAKARLDEIFAKSGSRVLSPYAPSLASRNEVFEKLRRNQKNILLIGRSSTGKSTFKNILADPTRISDALKAYSQTEFPIFEQYTVSGTDVIINFIDTPGLFQQTKSLPDNTTIIQLIDGYIRSKVTQLHFACFCMSMETKVNADDLHTVQQFFDFLGPDIRKNSCLIITKSESHSEHHKERICKEALTNLDFKVLASQMKQGIFFTGSINHDDWNDTSDAIYEQFENICEYRNKLINLFTNSDVKPFDLTTNVLARKIRVEINTKEKGKLT